MKAYIIETQALLHNIEMIKKEAGEAVIWAVLKGNGYGLGAVPFAQLLDKQGITHFAVFEQEEAIALRKAGFSENPILMLRGTSNEAEIHTLLDLNVTIGIGSQFDAAAVNAAAARRGTAADVHIAIDTGMGRYGFLPQETDQIISVYQDLPYLTISGIYTHFHTASSQKATRAQFAQFRHVLQMLKEAGCNPGMIHCCNSVSFLHYSDMHCDAVRIGTALLGRSAAAPAGYIPIGYAEAEVEELRRLPAGSTVGYRRGWKAKRDTTVAVVSIGWYHGFSLERGYDLFRFRDCFRGIAKNLKAFLTRKALYATVNGKRCRVVGHVGMMNLEIDVTDISCKQGDPVKLQINPILVKGLPIVFR